MEKGKVVALVLAELIYANGGCGPMGGEKPEVKDNHLYLSSQGPDEEYVIGEDGKVNLIPNKDMVTEWSYDTGLTAEEVKQYVLDNYQNMDVLDLIAGKTDLTFWMYLEEKLDAYKLAQEIIKSIYEAN